MDKKKVIKKDTTKDMEAERPIDFKLIDVAAETDENIGCVIKKLSTFMEIVESDVEGIDWTNCIPSSYNARDCLKIFEAYKLARKRPANPHTCVSTANERNNVVIRPDSMLVLEDEDPKALPPASYEVKLGMLSTGNDMVALANVAATIIAYTTKAPTDNDIGSTMDAEGAKKMSIPYVDNKPLRKAVNVVGLGYRQTRDAILQKLVKNHAEVLLLNTKIYSKPSLIPYSREEPDALRVYKKRQGKLPNLSSIRLPETVELSYKQNVNLDQCWRFLSDSRGIRGEDNNGIGILTIGYMWWDMDRSLFEDLCMTQDVMMICSQFKVDTVMYSGFTARVIRMLVANGITVYSNKRGVREDPKKDQAGYYALGNRRFIIMLEHEKQVPQYMHKRVEYPNYSVLIEKVLTKKKYVGAFALAYMTPPLFAEKRLSFYPSFRAHSGMCVVTSELPGVEPEDLIKRFYSSNHIRNLFPFTRLTFSQFDPFRGLFSNEIIIPRNIPRNVEVMEYTEVKIEKKNIKKTVFYDLEPVEKITPVMTAEKAHYNFIKFFDEASDDQIIAELKAIKCYPKLDFASNYMLVKQYSQNYSVSNDDYFNSERMKPFMVEFKRVEIVDESLFDDDIGLLDSSIVDDQVQNDSDGDDSFTVTVRKKFADN